MIGSTDGPRADLLKGVGIIRSAAVQVQEWKITVSQHWGVPSSITPAGPCKLEKTKRTAEKTGIYQLLPSNIHSYLWTLRRKKKKGKEQTAAFLDSGHGDISSSLSQLSPHAGAFPQRRLFHRGQELISGPGWCK